MKIKNLLVSTLFCLGLASAASAASFTFSGNSEGTVGNSRSFTASDSTTTVTVTAQSYYSSSYQNRAVGIYGGGLGVNDTSNSGSIDTGSPQHTVDNNYGKDMLLFTFNKTVTISAVSFGWVSGDSDFAYAFGSSGSSFTTLYPSLGSLVNGGSGPNAYNSGNGFAGGTGSFFLIAAAPNGGYNDYFKLSGLTFTPTVPDSGSALALLGLALVGLASLKCRFAA